MHSVVRALLGVAVLACSFPVNADIVSVAVASNFKDALARLGNDFEEQTGHVVRLSAASTGKHYAQISNGAPFDVFLAADDSRPQLLVKEGLAEADSLSTYAMGALLLWAPGLDGKDCKAELMTGMDRIAMANPKIAPYGVAAEQVIAALDLTGTYDGRIIMGENISQTMQFVDTRAVTAGFVAKSHWLVNEKRDSGCAWDVPGELHAPIRQQMVLLTRAKDSAAARAFVEFMNSAAAKQVIRDSGYATED